MKILRSVTRRGFTVGTAGMFTITTPNRWFAASQFPERFQRLGGHFKEATAKTPDPMNAQAATPPQIMILSTRDRHPMRFALAASLAVAIALFLLWWFFHIGMGWLGRAPLIPAKDPAAILSP